MPLLNSIVKQLSPLEDNLSSTIYAIFEKDSIKYIAYMQAIEERILQVHQKNESIEKGEKCISIALVGAGRGGILISIARAIKNVIAINLEIKISNVFVIEKNLNCRFSLEYLMTSHPDIASL